jgi:hypothetical protein
VAQLRGRAEDAEDDYWATRIKAGAQAPVSTFESQGAHVILVKMNGLRDPGETEFPSQYLPLIPVMGYELWIDGKRYLCGMTRRLMDGQRFVQLRAQSPYIEAIAMQPKAPFMAPFEASRAFEAAWKR